VQKNNNNYRISKTAFTDHYVSHYTKLGRN